MKIRSTINNEPKKSIDTDNILFRVTNLLKENSYDMIGPKIKKLEEMEKDLIEKEIVLNSLLSRSNKIEVETKEKLKSLKSENIVIRKKLIEMLGE